MRVLALALLAPAAAFAPSGRMSARAAARTAVRMEAEPKRGNALANIVVPTLITLSTLANVAPAQAAGKSFMEQGILEDCATSKGFDKRLNAETKKLEGRLAKYQPGTPPYLAIEQRLTQTKTRFKTYADSGLLCGKDGLPHLVTSGDPAHAPEFLIPAFCFLYTAGWIGWAGRKYLQTNAKTANPTMGEIIFDVPTALKIMSSGFLWPVYSYREFIAGDFVASAEEITVSPR